MLSYPWSNSQASTCFKTVRHVTLIPKKPCPDKRLVSRRRLLARRCSCHVAVCSPKDISTRTAGLGTGKLTLANKATRTKRRPAHVKGDGPPCAFFRSKAKNKFEAALKQTKNSQGLGPKETQHCLTSEP